MSWLAIFLLLPFFAALLLGRSTRFQLPAAFLMLVLLFAGQTGSAVVMWVSMLVLALLIPPARLAR